MSSWFALFSWLDHCGTKSFPTATTTATTPLFRRNPAGQFGASIDSGARTTDRRLHGLIGRTRAMCAASLPYSGHPPERGL
jgi:hypothetical protein